MLPIIDRPLIQYAVDEAREAGIEQLIFVTGAARPPSSSISIPLSNSKPP
jgi:UTP-glucose-1-phosphate uridylyltransferase